jgi:hypothetical protein
VRLEVDDDMPEFLASKLCEELTLDPARDVYRAPLGFHGLGGGFTAHGNHVRLLLYVRR